MTPPSSSAVDDDAGHTMYEGRHSASPATPSAVRSGGGTGAVGFPAARTAIHRCASHREWKPGGRTDLPNLALLVPAPPHEWCTARAGPCPGDANEELTYRSPHRPGHGRRALRRSGRRVTGLGSPRTGRTDRPVGRSGGRLGVGRAAAPTAVRAPHSPCGPADANRKQRRKPKRRSPPSPTTSATPAAADGTGGSVARSPRTAKPPPRRPGMPSTGSARSPRVAVLGGGGRLPR